MPDDIKLAYLNLVYLIQDYVNLVKRTYLILKP